MPYVRGHYHLETHNSHLGNECNNRPNKVINDFNIFSDSDITINNCQSTHTFIGDADPNHQTYTSTTTWIQAWWGPFFAWVVAKHVPGCPFPILSYIHHYKSPSRNHLQFCAFWIYTMTVVFWHCSRKFWYVFFYNTLVIFCFKQFSFNSSIRYRSNPILVYISNFLEWTFFFVRFYNPI